MSYDFNDHADEATKGREMSEKGAKMQEPKINPFVHSTDYAALLARHNALVEAVHIAMGRTADCDKGHTNEQLIADVAYLKRLSSDYFKTSIKAGTVAFAAMRDLEELREAVRWERECQLVRHYIIFEALETCALREITRSISAARAEVDEVIRGE